MSHTAGSNDCFLRFAGPDGGPKGGQWLARAVNKALLTNDSSVWPGLEKTPTEILNRVCRHHCFFPPMAPTTLQHTPLHTFLL
jgi:hypothetical protein